MRREFTFLSFAVRFLFAVLLVYVTYNPSQYSFFHWVKSDMQSMLPAKIFVGVVLVIGWVIFIRAAMNSLGGIGFVLAAAFFGAFIWLLVDWGVLPITDTKVIVYVVEFALAGILAVGMSWSHIRRRLSGQFDTDEIEG